MTIEEYHRTVDELAHAVADGVHPQAFIRDKLLAVLDAHAARIKSDIRAMMANPTLRRTTGPLHD